MIYNLGVESFKSQPSNNREGRLQTGCQRDANALLQLRDSRLVSQVF